MGTHKLENRLGLTHASRFHPRSLHHMSKVSFKQRLLCHRNMLSSTAINGWLRNMLSSAAMNGWLGYLHWRTKGLGTEHFP